MAKQATSLRTTTLLSVIVLGLATLFIAGGLFLLRTDTAQDAAEEAGPGEGASISEASVGERPDCPARSVGGVDLPCLGAAPAGAEESGITVVNVWAWWCEPCREELPVLEEFAAAYPEYTVVGVHADANAANGAALLTDLGSGLPSYQDDANRFAGHLGLPGVVPVTVVVRDGDLVASLPRVFHSAEELAAAVAEVV